MPKAAARHDPQRELPHEIPRAASELALGDLNNRSLGRTQLSAAFKEPNKQLFTECQTPIIESPQVPERSFKSSPDTAEHQGHELKLVAIPDALNTQNAITSGRTLPNGPPETPRTHRRGATEAVGYCELPT